MGLTIHYEFKFKGSGEEVKARLQGVWSAAIKLGFKSVSKMVELDYSKHFNDDLENIRCGGDDYEGYRWIKIQYEPRGKWVGDKHFPENDTAMFKGWAFRTWAGKGCEPTNIGLISKDGENWIGSAFTKTQYAEQFVSCHLLVITLLDYCKQVGILERVSDEGDYWKTRDLSVLGGNINQSTKFITQMNDVLKSVAGDFGVESAIDKSKNYVKVLKKKRI